MKKSLLYVLTLLLMFNFFIIGVNAKDKITLKECEYSDAYKEWLKLSDKEKEKTIMPAICKDAYLLKNYKLGNSTTIPEKYDLRDKNYINGVKDQKDTGLCWGFSALSCIESNLLVKGLGKYDFSEGHIDLALSNDLYTPNRVTFNRNADAGGNPMLTQAYLLNHWGPINESDLNFEYYHNILNKAKSVTANEIESKKAIVDINETVIISNAQGACDDNSIKTIKNYILKNGAMNGSLYMSAMYAEGTVLTGTTLMGPYINGAYYYYDGSAFKEMGDAGANVSANATPDHAITIVGWDDTINLSNFASEHQPSRNGAWIVQNSYGEALDSNNVKIDMGDAGYYYISYDDINICGMLGGYYDADLEVPDNSYYYDDLGFFGLGYTSTDDNLYQGAVYTKKSENNEILDKVTFATYELGVKYKVYFADNGSLKDYREISSGTTDHFGYTTIKLNEKIEITSDKYSVIVKFENVKDKLIPVSAKYAGYTDWDSLVIKSGVTFISTDGTSWADTQEGEFNILVRAYTNETSKTTEPEEKPGDDEVKDDSEVEVEKNDGSVVDKDTTEQGSSTESEKDEVVESPKTGIEDYIFILFVGGILVASVYYFLSKKNIIKKI